MKDRQVKIGLDFHGVISKRPSFFSEFTNLAIKNNCQIHIITGGPLEQIKKYLEEHKIVYNNIFAILDYYESLGMVEYFSDGKFKIQDDLWDSAKAKYCSLNHIDIHIDDSVAYKKWFQTKFCLYDEASKQCYINDNQKVNFSKSAQSALDEILFIIKQM